MASYLEEYGAAEQQHARRLKIVKWSGATLLAVLVVGFTLFTLFRNHSEEQQVKLFVDRLKNKDFQTAYHMWGCTDATPCRDYTFKQFMEDWGPGSPHADASTARVGSGDTCGSGVVVAVDFKGTDQTPLWVEKANNTIGFSPDPECRKKRWHFREFLHSLFNKESLLHLNY